MFLFPFCAQVLAAEEVGESSATEGSTHSGACAEEGDGDSSDDGGGTSLERVEARGGPWGKSSLAARGKPDWSDEDSLNEVVIDEDYVPGATRESTILQPIPIFYWKKVLHIRH